MKHTSLIAVGAFAALLALYLATRESNPSAGTKRLDLTSLAPSKVTSVELSGAQNASLRRDGDGWKVGDKPADAALVQMALDALAKVNTTEVVTERAEKHAEYEVDAAKALKVKVAREGLSEPMELWVGKTARNGGAYVRRPNEDTVFVASGGLSWQLRRQTDQWRKKTFVPFKADEVTELTVHPAGEPPYTVRKDGTTWKLASPNPPPAGFRFDAAAAANVVGQLVTLSAQEFGDHLSDEAAAFADVVEARVSGGRTVTVRFGAGQGSQALVPVRVDGDAQIYLVPKWAADNARKPLGALRDLTLLDFDPARVSRIELRSGTTRVALAKEGESWKVVEPKNLPAGFELDPSGVPMQLASFRAIRAVKQLEAAARVPDAQAGLSRPAATLELSLEGGGKQTLRLGKPVAGAANGGELYARGAIDSGLYAISAAEKARLERGLDLFKRRPPPSFAGGGRGLDQLPPELRRQLEASLRAQASPQ